MSFDVDMDAVDKEIDSSSKRLAAKKDNPAPSSTTAAPKSKSKAKAADKNVEGPLNGLVIIVDAPKKKEDLEKKLQNLGAKIATRFNNTLTHLVIEGGKVTSFEKAKEKRLYIVNANWVEECKLKNTKINESSYEVNEYESESEKSKKTTKKDSKSKKDEDKEEEEEPENKKKTDKKKEEEKKKELDKKKEEEKKEIESKKKTDKKKDEKKKQDKKSIDDADTDKSDDGYGTEIVDSPKKSPTDMLAAASPPNDTVKSGEVSPVAPLPIKQISEDDYLLDFADNDSQLIDDPAPKTGQPRDEIIKETVTESLHTKSPPSSGAKKRSSSDDLGFLEKEEIEKPITYSKRLRTGKDEDKKDSKPSSKKDEKIIDDVKPTSKKVCGT